MHRQGSPATIAQLGEFAQTSPRRTHKPHTVDVILQRAHAFTTKRYGTGLSARQLRRMVGSGLVPGPKPSGRRRGLPPEWQWSFLSYRRVLQVCRMKKRGFSRTHAIIFNLWLDGAVYEFPAVRTATVREFRRLRKVVSRRVPAAWDPRVEGKELAPRSRAAVLKGLGNEQSVFPVLSSETLLQFAGAMLFGAQMHQDTMLAMFRAYGMPETLIDELGRDDPVLVDLDLGLRTLAGLAADPDDSEIAAETALEDSDEETFANIRDYAREASLMYGMVPALVTVFFSPTHAENAVLRDICVNATEMLRDPSYRLLHFVLMVRRAQLKGDHGRGVGAFARLVLRPLRRLTVFVASDMETQSLLQRAAKRIGTEQEVPLSVVLSVLFARPIDPALRSIGWRLILTTWRHGLADLWKLRKPLKSNVRSAREPTHTQVVADGGW